jgi:hypothetical protein
MLTESHNPTMLVFFHSMILRRRYLALLVATAISGASSVGFAQETEHRKALIVHPSASGVSYAQVGSTDQVSYHVEEKFPASHVIGFIAFKLRKAGWEPLSYDFMNPDTSSPQIRKWGEMINGTKQPLLNVQQWIGQWKDSSGNIVEYVYRYLSPVHARDPLCTGDTSNLNDLQVDGIYFSASAVREYLEVFDQLKKEHPRK